MRVVFKEESRFGLFIRNGPTLTGHGIEPLCAFQQEFESTYLWGAFSSLAGEYFVLELPQANTVAFQTFLDKFSKHKPE